VVELEEELHTSREDKKAPTAPTPGGLSGPVGIRRGKQVTNKATDQSTVIGLLNEIPLASGGTLTPDGPTRFKAPRDGFCDPALAAKIKQFQEHNGLVNDGVVDPGGRTLRAMRIAAGESPPAGAHLFGRELAIQDAPLATRKVD